MKWLIDESLNPRLHHILARKGIDAESVYYRGWDSKKNGELMLLCYPEGFRVMLTADTNWHHHSGFASSKYFDFCVVILTNQNVDDFLQWFEDQFDLSPIKPLPGRVVVWPE